MMDTKPLIDDKLRGSTFDEIEELKVSHFGGGAAMRARDSLLLDGLPDSMGRFKTTPENQFKSLYSFQTFKWLIF
jgi:hypothetical protein